ncbi:MAG TPA: MlaD family protein [Pseudomonadales bacterium]|nr:MlaD family protein [Pseudomonadales bacterium]
MSEKKPALPKAKIEKDFMTWFIWLLPVAAVGLCGWFLLHDFIFAGPTITIYFQNADGLQEQNSMVKYRGIKIGQIESLKLADKEGRVAVRAKLDYSAGNIARQGTVFWIVRPEVKLGAISGLQTIVSGNFITAEPGSGERTNTFIGAEEAPVQPEPGIIITLLADDLGALQNQSEIFYRGVQVGEVLDFRLGDDSRHIVVHARILQNFAPLVRMNSKFWNAGGINAHLGLFSGLNITAESAQTLISGGIALATPTDYGPAATNGAVFMLSDKADSTWQDWNPVIPLQAVPAAAGEKSPLPDIQAH